jgi:diaminopimelate epimerase
VVSGQIQGLLDNEVTVNLLGGDLVVKWQGGDAPVWITGPAAFVYEGSIQL